MRIPGGLWRAVFATAVVLAVNACSGVSNAPTVPDSDPSGTATSALARLAPTIPGKAAAMPFEAQATSTTAAPSPASSIQSKGWWRARRRRSGRRSGAMR